MSTRRFIVANEPLVNPDGTMTRNWYQSLLSLVSNLVDVSFATPPDPLRYLCNWSDTDEMRVTLNQPALQITNQGATDGARLTMVLIQGLGGNHTVTFTSETDFGSAGQPTLSTAEGARDRLELRYNAKINTYDVVSFAKGFGS